MEANSKLNSEKDETNENDENDDSTDDDIEASEEEDASECKDGDEAVNEESDADKREKIKLLRKRAHHALSGRGITLAMLLADGIIEPGTDFMSLDYMGQKFTADLLPDGRIKWKEEDAVFCSPSAWATHCKKMVNPDNKKSGCGWSAVRYQGKKLDALKSCWFKKHRQLAQDTYGKIGRDNKEEGESDAKKLKFTPTKSSENTPASTPGALTVPHMQTPGGVGKLSSVMTSPASHPLSQSTPHFTSPFSQSSHQQSQLSPKAYSQVKPNALGRVFTDHDRRTLIECTTFAALARVQPFNLSVTSSCLAIIDFHCHLLTSEVLGYIGGKWDPTLQQLQLLKAYPITQRATDEQAAANIEREIQELMFGEGLCLVGWYHSHPSLPASPTLADTEAQMAYQLLLKAPGNTFQPCVSVIVSPYESNTNKESAITIFWVMPPSEQRPLDFGVPISLEYCTQDEENNEQTRQALMNAMSTIYSLCQKDSSAVNFNEKWDANQTIADKLKISLTKRLKDKSYKTVTDFVKTLGH